MNNTYPSLRSSILSQITTTPQNEWPTLFEKETLAALYQEISTKNFFTESYPIIPYLSFLQEWAKQPIHDIAIKNLFSSIDTTLFDTISKHSSFTKEQVSTVTHYLQFLKPLYERQGAFTPSSRGIPTTLFNKLSTIVEHVLYSKENTVSLLNLFWNYVEIVRSVLNSKELLVSQDTFSDPLKRMGKKIFQNEKDFRPLIIKLYNLFGHKYESLTYFQSRDGYNLGPWVVQKGQRFLLREISDLQGYFLDRIAPHHALNQDTLKHYFFKYFVEKTKDNALILRCNQDLSSYCLSTYKELPYELICRQDSPKITIDYQWTPSSAQNPGFDSETALEACRAITCARSSYSSFLLKLGVNPITNETNYIYRAFPNRESWKTDFFSYRSEGPLEHTAGLYYSGSAPGTGGYGYYSGDSSWWREVSGHEYVHHLNWNAFGRLPRILNEGLASLISQGMCNVYEVSNVTLTLLTDKFPLDYNQATLLSAYLVATSPPLFSRALVAYQKKNLTLYDQYLEQFIISHSEHFIQWKQYYADICSAYKDSNRFKVLGQDNQCPSNRLEDYQGFNDLSSSSQTLSSSTPHYSRENTVYPPHQVDSRDLIYAVFNKNLKQLRNLLDQGADPNYTDYHTGNTVLHYVGYYGFCNANAVQLLLEKNANPQLKNSNNETASEMIEKNCSNWKEEIKPLFDQTQSTQETPSTTDSPRSPYSTKSTLIFNVTESHTYPKEEKSTTPSSLIINNIHWDETLAAFGHGFGWSALYGILNNAVGQRLRQTLRACLPCHVKESLYLDQLIEAIVSSALNSTLHLLLSALSTENQEDNTAVWVLFAASLLPSMLLNLVGQVVGHYTGKALEKTQCSSVVKALLKVLFKCVLTSLGHIGSLLISERPFLQNLANLGAHLTGSFAGSITGGTVGQIVLLSCCPKQIAKPTLIIGEPMLQLSEITTNRELVNRMQSSAQPTKQEQQLLISSSPQQANQNKREHDRRSDKFLSLIGEEGEKRIRTQDNLTLLRTPAGLSHAELNSSAQGKPLLPPKKQHEVNLRGRVYGPQFFNNNEQSVSPYVTLDLPTQRSHYAPVT